MSSSAREGMAPFNVGTYLVLLQDCLAIKFVPLVSSLSYHKNKINPSNHGVHIRSGGSGDQYCGNNCTGAIKDANSKTSTLNKCSSHPSQNHQCSTDSCQKRQDSLPHYLQTHISSAKKNITTNSVDHSLHGLFLYKEFVQVNLQCFWNDAVYETFNNLEYKGYVVPSTILVTSTSNRYLNVLKTAWSRKMIHSVPGYRIEFIGEIEEMIADPIQKSHFVPLADTLCWAIYEITSSGREAFVDEILTELRKTFETMVQPSRELVYETLEKLTRAKKVYQTAGGYFVVTPDTYRYIVSCDDTAHHNKVVDTCALLGPTMVKQKLLQGDSPGNVFVTPDHNSERKKSLLHSSDSPQTETTAECDNVNNGNFNDDFKRSSSLKLFPRKEHSSGQFSRSRSLSLRVPRNKKNDVDSQSISKLDKDLKNLNLDDEKTGSKMLKTRKSKGTFLSRLLSFRRTAKNKKAITSSKSVSKKTGTKSKRKVKNVEHEICTQSMSTQTSLSMENMNELAKVSTSLSGSNIVAAEDSDSGRYTESSSDAEITAALASSPVLSTKAEGGLPERKDEVSTPGWSINDPMYEKLRSQYNCSQFSLRHDLDADNSSELITLSNKNTSDCESGPTPTKDYCKSSNSSSSPCPSTSISDRSTSSLSSYRDLYNFYRRRHPSYPTQGLNSSMKKANTTTASSIRPKLNDVRRQSFRKVFPLKKPATASSTPNEQTYKIQSKSETSGSNVASTTTTTTVTQTVKSDSNVELELLLPLEKLINAALLAQREKSEKKLNVDVSNGNNQSSNERTKENSGGLRTELVTNVNDLFSIRSHVSISPDDAMSSTIEIKTKSMPKMESVSVKPTEFREDCRESEII